MNGAGVKVSSMIAAIFLLLSIGASAQEEQVRGAAGLPTYIKAPSDRPPPVGIEPRLIEKGMTTNAFLSTIPIKDSVIVINGKLDLGGREYVFAYPVFRAGSLYGVMKACKKEYLMKPQYKATEKEGYSMFVVVRDTATEPDCWDQFRTLGAVDLSCDQIMVKTSDRSDPVAWINPDSSYANSYDLRRFTLDPVTPK